MSTIQSDRARVSDREDLYGWSKAFVPMLAKVTRKWPPRDGLTFGVYGPWGSGKSTVLNLLESELKNDSAAYPHTYIVRFNPWFYDSSQTLVTSFFASVGAALETDEGKDWGKAGKLLKKMGKFLAVASKGLTVAGIGYDSKQLESAAAVFSEAGEFAELADKGEAPLRKTRDDLIEHLNRLGDAGGRIMVLIDDVDRLDSDELLMLLRLVRTVADLPCITLLVSMDEHRVCDVLDGEAQRGYGRAYLEKIVQAHVHVPVPPEDRMDEQLRTGISQILEAAGADTAASLSPRNGTGTRVLSRIVRTPRDLGRFLNGLRILTLARQTWDLDPTDAIHLAALHVFYPEVYERVRRSRGYLTNGRDGGRDPTLPPRSLDWLLTGSENGRANDPEADEAAELIREMFGEYGAAPSPGAAAPSLSDRRIASPEVFHAYFAFDTEPEWIPRARLRTCIERMAGAAGAGNRQRFLELLREIVDDKRLFAELTRLDLVSALCALDPDQAASFADCLLNLAGQLDAAQWRRVWDAYVSSTHKLQRKHPGYDVMRRLTAPVERWINSAPNADEKAARSRAYKVGD